MTRTCILTSENIGDEDDCSTHKHEPDVIITVCGKCGVRITQDGIYWSDVNGDFTDGSHQHGPGDETDAPRNDYSDFLGARIDAKDAANGDSNDAEIECLQMALDMADHLLVKHGIFTQEELND